MGIKQILKQTVLRADLLSSNASLRYKGEPVYESVCGGFLSLVIVIVFTIIFVNTLISLMYLQEITSTEELNSNLDSASTLQNFMFAIGINGISLQDFQSYFSIELLQSTNQIAANNSGGKNKDWRQDKVQLVPCSVNQFTSFGISDMETFYTRRNISQMFCPSADSNYSIQGTQDQDTYKYLTLIVTGCHQQFNNSNCVNQTQKQSFITNWIFNNDFFQVKLYVMDTIITATNQDPITHYIETDVFMAFTSTTGTVGNIKLADYQIDTDTSFLPWTQYDTLTGYYVDSFDTSTINQSKQKYVKIDISKSTKMRTITRQYGKIDDALSYVGGLFSLLFVAVQFFMASYNEYRYELSVGEALFNYDQKGTQFKEEDFGFLNYILYSIYDWCAFFKLQPNWQLYYKYHQTRQQANQQLDVRYLMKKIRYLESAVQILISQDQQLCLSLIQLPTLNQTQKKRNISQFAKNIRSDQKILTNIMRKRKNSVQSRMSLMSQNSKRIIPVAQQIFPNPSSKNNDQITEHRINMNEMQSQKSDNSEDIGFLVSEAFLRIQKEKQDPLNKKIYSKIPQEIVTQVKNQMKQSRQKNRMRSQDVIQFSDIVAAQRMIIKNEKVSKIKKKSEKNIKQKS